MVRIWRLTVGRGGPTSVRLEFVLCKRAGVTVVTLASAPKSGQTKIAGLGVRKLGVQSEGRVMRRFRDPRLRSE